MNNKIKQILNENELLEFINNKQDEKFREYIDKNIFCDDNLSVYTQEDLLDLIQYLDLTSLNSTDNRETISEFVKKSVFLFNNKAYYTGGICCFSNFLNQINQYKPSPQIKSVVVAAGFPHSQLPLSAKLEEIKYCIENGADEIDICLNRGKFFEGKTEEIAQEISSIKELINNSEKEILLKVILEVGELEEYFKIYQASLLCLESGADFIKTSTGKIQKGADIYSSIVMMLALREYYRKSNLLKGIKIAGGIRTPLEAIQYMNLYKLFISSNMDNKLFRIGCSQLFEKLQFEILKK